MFLHSASRSMLFFDGDCDAIDVTINEVKLIVHLCKDNEIKDISRLQNNGLFMVRISL